MDLNSVFDIIVVGGGPAGISAAIFGKRLGKQVIILEKGPVLSPEPRGETLHNDPILDEILGDGVMESLALSKTEYREYFPPLPTRDAMVELIRKTPSIVFEWREWINHFSTQIENLEIPCIFNAEVFDVIKEKNRVIGIKYRDKNGTTQKINGKTVFICDGHKTIIGRKFHSNYRLMNFPIVKCLMKNGNHKSKAFKYFLVPAGALEYAPDFPPFIIFLFPRDEQNLETGMMIQTDIAEQLGLRIPPINEIMGVWVKIKKDYPIFSEMIGRASITHEDITTIPMTGPITKYNPIPGLVFLGDAAGFVEASGGSGLVASIKMAKYWVNALNSNGSESTIETKFRASELHKHIAKVAKRYNGFRKFLYVRLRTATRIRKMWWLLKLILKLA
ncbi:MAG: FAD-dependent oxidoreductase [Promethearchaeota archaeon]